MTPLSQETLTTALMLTGFGLSALFSGMEMGVYSLNRVRLEILADQASYSAALLRRLTRDPVTLLSTLLIGNNIANYLGTLGLALLLEHRGFADWQVILLNVAIVTPILFVFCETLPKDLFAAYSDRLTYRLAPAVEAIRRLLTWTGLLPIVMGFTRMVEKLLPGSRHHAGLHPRRHMQLLVSEGVGRGLLSDEQSVLVERVLALNDLRVVDEAVPWSKVISVKLSDPPAALFRLADRTSLSRFPVLDDQGRVAGVVSLYDALQHDPASCPPVAQLMRPAVTVEPQMPLRAALRLFQKQRLDLAIVAGREDAPRGLVTVKDLVEPITGELVAW
ncbi:MAG: DUF21 domain-containing protein [Phycisphaeraceae bacterium]|nr:DUF21 domain-containing protein [Phycisphaeraceae bacterium]